MLFKSLLKSPQNRYVLLVCKGRNFLKCFYYANHTFIEKQSPTPSNKNNSPITTPKPYNKDLLNFQYIFRVLLSSWKSSSVIVIIVNSVETCVPNLWWAIPRSFNEAKRVHSAVFVSDDRSRTRGGLNLSENGISSNRCRGRDWRRGTEPKEQRIAQSNRNPRRSDVVDSLTYSSLRPFALATLRNPWRVTAGP